MNKKEFNWGLSAGIVLPWACLIGLAFLLFGCTQMVIVNPDGSWMQYNSAFKDVKVDRAFWQGFKIERATSESVDIKAVGPYGAIGLGGAE